MQVTSCPTTSLFQHHMNGVPLWELPVLEPYRNIILTSFWHDFNFEFLKINCLLLPHLTWKGIIVLKQVHSHSAETWPHHSVFKGWISPSFKTIFIPYSDKKQLDECWKAAVDTTGTWEGHSEEHYENVLCRPSVWALKKNPLDRNNRWIDSCLTYLKIQHCCKIILWNSALN